MMRNKIIARVSGEYPRSVVISAISSLEGDKADEVSFLIGDLIEDASFDLSSASDIATIIGTALTVVQLALLIVIRRYEAKTLVQQQTELEITERIQNLPEAKDYRIAIHVNILSFERIEISTHISSKIHLESIEVTSSTFIDQNKSEVSIGTIKRGEL